MSETNPDVSYLMNQPELWAVIVELNDFLAGHGKDKHGDDDWKKKSEKDHAENADCHIADWFESKYFDYEGGIDPDTGKSHLINATARCMMARAKELSQERIDKAFLTMPELEYGSEPIEP